jgi:glucan 1,3-beta-glucosidase
MFEPYGPYVGCTDGAVNELERVLAACARFGLKVLIDLHGTRPAILSNNPSVVHMVAIDAQRVRLCTPHSYAAHTRMPTCALMCSHAVRIKGVRYSQNGFDNSGFACNVSWKDDTYFQHWPTRSAGWQGTFDPTTFTYSTISWDNMRSTVGLLQKIAQRFGQYSCILGIEALNEPWQFTPIDVLKAFYWDAYWAVRASAPKWCARTWNTTGTRLVHARPFDRSSVD